MPSPGLFFLDPLTNDYYTDEKGNVLKLLDFGNLRAGETTIPKPVVVQNGFNMPVTNVRVTKLIDIPAPDRLEISKTQNPFVPEDEIVFEGVHAPYSDIGTFYVRVVAHKDSEGIKPFRFKARADLVDEEE